jgi:serine/threonine protein kinase
MNRAERKDSGETPQSFGRYRIRGVLGEGGMGRLYVAEKTGIEGFAKIVALKRILPHLADSPPFRTLFLNEARIAARLEHHNIVATYELGEVDGTYFMALEYLPGEDLGAVLARCDATNRMPVEVAALLAQQSANGLHYAHELRDGAGRPAGLVHRDVNPSNIFITYHGMVKLLDFGVVKASSASNKTTPGVFKGKYAYCAPEQLLGETVDPRTDVFSVGIVLWECLTGRRLFESPNDAGTIDAVRTQPIVPPSHHRPEVPAELDEIAMRALSRDREQRYKNASELSEALDRFLGGKRHRPTSNTVGQWLEALFGAERAALKRAIAQGNDVEGALAKLGKTEPPKPPTSPSQNTASRPLRTLSTVRPRPLWSTGVERGTGGTQAGQRRVAVTTIEQGQNTIADGTPPPTDLVSQPPPPPVTPRPPVADAPIPIDINRQRPPGSRMRLVIIVAAAVVVIGGVAAALTMTRPAPGPARAPAAALGGLAVESEPPGAHILVDGDPSGLDTPAVLRDLKVGRMVEIRLDKNGYVPAIKRVEVKAGEPAHQLFRLTEAVGTLHLQAVPSGASVYIDDAPADAAHPLSLSLGPHQVRVETADGVLFSDNVVIHAGEQTVRIPAERRAR